MVIIINSSSTWPEDVLNFLETNIETFIGWQCESPRELNHIHYDNSIDEMRKILRKYSLIGNHCTKLTRKEINNIRNNGLSLQNSTSLNNRIDMLLEDNEIESKIASILKNVNQSDEPNRAKMLWFVFYEPYIAEESGIERFFRSWGGEALYNSHEHRLDTGSVLLNIGIPCVIKANIPIKSLNENCYPDRAIIRIFLKSKGYKITNAIYHEGYSLEDIPQQNIIDIIEFPSSQFIELTKCDEWETKLYIR